MALPGTNEALTISRPGLEGGAPIVPIHDALGTVLGGVDSAGNFAYQYSYTPFGAQSLVPSASATPSGYGNVYGMAGMELDPTGLYHAGARYYNPRLRRFISEDPVRGKPNLFSYAGNNPVMNADPTGLSEEYSFSGFYFGTIQVSLTPSGLLRPIQQIIDLFKGQTPSPPGYLVRYVYDFSGQHNAYSLGASGNASGANNPENMLTQVGPRLAPCSGVKSAFISANLSAARKVAAQLKVPVSNILGLAALESKWGKSSIAINAGNFFGLHAGAPGSIGTYTTAGGAKVAEFSGFAGSAQSFATDFGPLVSGISDPAAFAQALVPKFNSANSNYVPALRGTINSVSGCGY
ncbi:MAG: RHS repeat-associated core domain-containing protein [Candidatus Binataceae bacterium]